MTLLGVGVGGGNVVGLQVTAEADGELVTRAEDLDAGVTQPQGIADRRRSEVGEGGRSRDDEVLSERTVDPSERPRRKRSRSRTRRVDGEVVSSETTGGEQKREQRAEGSTARDEEKQDSGRPRRRRSRGGRGRGRSGGGSAGGSSSGAEAPAQES